ncbi:MAG: response regulator [Planctomycetota bacterium]
MSSPPKTLRVLLVDDDPAVLQVLGAWLRRAEGVELTTAVDADETVAHCTHSRFDLVLLDHHMPGRDGSEALRDILALPTRPRRVVMISGMLDECPDGADRLLKKPFPLGEIDRELQFVRRRDDS